jgi:hypothetical protein
MMGRMEEYRHDSCADKGARAVIKKHRIDNDVKTVDVHVQLEGLENRRKERACACTSV